jgi:hypothetical protein
MRTFSTGGDVDDVAGEDRDVERRVRLVDELVEVHRDPLRLPVLGRAEDDDLLPEVAVEAARERDHLEERLVAEHLVGVRLFHGARHRDLLRLVLLDEDRDLRVPDVALLEELGDRRLELTLGEPRDLETPEEGKGDRPVVGDPHGLVELLEVEDGDLQEILPPDPVVGAALLEEGHPRLDRQLADRPRLEDRRLRLPGRRGLGGRGGACEQEKEEAHWDPAKEAHSVMHGVLR